MADLRGKNVLLTGCTGFIGSHVADVLIEAGANITGFVHYTGRNDVGLLDSTVANHVRFTAFKGDLLDEDAVEKAVAHQDIVLHLGALISIPFSYENPNLTTQVNVIGTLNVLQACLKHKATIQRIVVTSTSEVYGSADILPITENHPLKAQSPYSASKIAADAIARSFYCSYELPVIIARPFNSFGPRQSDRAIIPTIISQALSGKESIEVGSLHPKRDFVFATDIADAFVRCATAPDELNGETVHFGTGKSYSVQDIIDRVQCIINTNKTVVQVPYRKRPNQSEVLHLLSDSSKAKKLLDWQPTVDFETGLRRVVDYIRQHPERYSPNGYQK